MYPQFNRQFGVDQSTRTIRNTPLWFGLFLKVVVVLVIIVIVYYALSDIWRLQGTEIAMGVVLSMFLAVVYLAQEYVLLNARIHMFAEGAADAPGQSGGGKNWVKKDNTMIKYPIICALFVAPTIGIVISIISSSHASAKGKPNANRLIASKQLNDMSEKYDMKRRRAGDKANAALAGVQGNMAKIAGNTNVKLPMNLAHMGARVKQATNVVRRSKNKMQEEGKVLPAVVTGTVGNNSSRSSKRRSKKVDTEGDVKKAPAGYRGLGGAVQNTARAGGKVVVKAVEEVEDAIDSIPL